MCGISAVIHVSSADVSGKHQCCSVTQVGQQQLSALRRRGPDFFSSSASVREGNFEIKFCATVLHQRGSCMSPQPLRNSLGNILLWNGEAFGGLDLTGEQNDGEELLSLFSTNSDPQNLLSTLSKIQGPWAFIYWEFQTKRLWFGRDSLGRRSLLLSSQAGRCCQVARICSVADVELGVSWEEIPSSGIFYIDTKNSKVVETQQHLWVHNPSGKPNSVEENVLSAIMNISLKESLNLSLPKCGTPSDLYRVDLDQISPAKSPLDFLSLLRTSPALREAVETFTLKMEEAVGKRTQNQPFLCKDCMRGLLNGRKLPSCRHASVAVLFSGGVDSIFLAALADKFLPREQPIDLLNVSFQHKLGSNSAKNKRHQLGSERFSFDSPDQISGKAGLEELKALAPSRIWNFVEINVTTEELREERTNHIQHLIAPSKTVLDDSIGCAIWFAARGKGLLKSVDGNSVTYVSPSRVVLVGMGADEQLAGYSRHRVKYSNSGWEGLIEEVALEMDRISCRNLGRDDRMISDHGREARFPFLDEDVMCYLKSLPMWLKANMELPRGIGEKLLLRLSAVSLGLTASCVLPKRAVQFGSRIARSEDRKEKGSDVCARLT